MTKSNGIAKVARHIDKAPATQVSLDEALDVAINKQCQEILDGLQSVASIESAIVTQSKAKSKTSKKPIKTRFKLDGLTGDFAKINFQIAGDSRTLYESISFVFLIQAANHSHEARQAFNRGQSDSALSLFANAERLIGAANSMLQHRLVESGISKAHALVCHSKPGGSHDKNMRIKAIWASGKYSSRDICAEQECAALEMSFSSARRALRGTPYPT